MHRLFGQSARRDIYKNRKLQLGASLLKSVLPKAALSVTFNTAYLLPAYV